MMREPCLREILSAVFLMHEKGLRWILKCGILKKD